MNTNQTDAGRATPTEHAGAFTRRTAAVAAAHLLLAGVVNAVVGVALLALVATGRLVPLIVSVLPEYVSQSRAVELGGAVGWVGTELAAVVGVALLALSAVQCYGAREARASSRWLPGFAASLTALCNPLSAPLGGISAVLLLLSRGVFGESSRSEP